MVLWINESLGSRVLEKHPLAHGVIENTEDYLKAMYMWDIPMYLCGGVYRKDLFDPKIFEENARQGIFFGEDWVTNMIAGLKVNCIKYIEDVTYHYYTIETSITHSVVTSVSYIDRLDKVLEAAGVFKMSTIAEKRRLNMCVNYLGLFFKPEQKFSMRCYRYVRDFISSPDNYKELNNFRNRYRLRFIKCLPVYFTYTCIFRFLYLWRKQGGKKRRILK